MKISNIIVLLFFTCVWQACQFNNTAGQGQLLSDGYISFIADSTSIIAHDSATAGDPGMWLLNGSFGNSTLIIAGGSAQLNIAHCKDTGIYYLSVSPDNAEYTPGSVQGNISRVSYSTDSVNTGVLHLTRLDSVNGRIGGTFSFTAGLNNNGVASHAIQIKNGLLFDFPITVVKN